jgi:UDP-glucose 4-epimerase
MNVLVTGSLGFIGGHLSERLIKLGHTVIGIDNLNTGLDSTKKLLLSYNNLPNSCNYIHNNLDIRHKDLYKIFDIYRPKVVFHLAAITGVVNSILDPLETNDVNVNGTVNLLHSAAASGVNRFVFSSSSSVYGGIATLPTREDDPLSPKSPYALQKKIGEEYCKMFSEKYNLDTVCLRYFNVFGPRQRADSPYAAVISSFSQAKKEDKSPIIYGDGKQFRDFTYIKNVVRANTLAGFRDEGFSGEIFNIGCGNRIDLFEILNHLECKQPIFKDTRPGDVRASQADIRKAKRLLGYIPDESLAEQLKTTLQWYLSN